VDINPLTSLSDNIRIDRDKCTACGRCAEVCILDNLRLQLSPCRRACPVGMNCQGYIRHVAQGRPDKGLEKVREASPFARILARVCARPCEAACNRIKVDGQAVAIRDLKRFLADRGDRLAEPAPEIELPHTVAIVGAGPAGLTAAFHLRRAGFRVTLYDRESEPGGLMRWAIPEFRLPLDILGEELRFINTMGITFEGNRVLGRDLDPAALERDFDAVLLSTGAYGKIDLDVPGGDSPSVIPVLRFMRDVREKKGPRLEGRVVVIGGGNAAVDAAQTARHLGAAHVTLVCLEERGQMPAFSWDVKEAEEEGVRIINGWGPQSFQFNEGRLAGLTFRKCVSLCDASGCFCPSYDEGTVMRLEGETVIAAISQKIDTDMVCDPLTLQVDNRGFFLAGDVVQGPRTIVEAMGQGREAAISIERMLKGESLWYERGDGQPFETDFEPDWSRAVRRDRVAAPTLSVSLRAGFDELKEGLSGEEAVAEAGRCLACGVPFGLRTCWFCLPCEIECPEEALHVEIPYLLR
jgi:NADPH-dependent glutamate synthase beta subunit-like oxidoreductase